MTAALEVVGLHKSFGALRVARDINFALDLAVADAGSNAVSVLLKNMVI